MRGHEVTGAESDPDGTRSTPGSEQESISPLLPLSEVVVGFGPADPNAEDTAELAAAEAAEKEGRASDAGGSDARRRRVRTRRPWERLGRSLNPEAESADTEDSGKAEGVFLWYRRGTEDESLPWSSSSLTVSYMMLYCR